MLREVFKKQIVLLSSPNEPLVFATRLAIDYKDLNEDAIDDLLSPQDSYDFKEKEKVFFLPGCTIARFKTNNYFKSIGVSLTKNSKSADVVIVGEETGKSILKKDVDHYSCSLEYLEEYIEKKYSIGDPESLEIKNILESDDCYPYFIFKDYNVYREWNNYKTVATLVVKSWITEEKRLRDIEDAILEGKIIVKESFLMDKCNQTVMTEEMYEETRKIFESADKNNHVLALELMANCNYQKSAMYLLMLFKEFRSAIYNTSESRHVNFSSLCTFFDLELGNWIDFDDVVKKLIEKNCITKEDYKKLITLAKAEFGDNLDSEYFRYSDIEPTETFINALEEAEQKALKISTQSPIQAETQESIISEEHE
jgi:hypothetical protein